MNEAHARGEPHSAGIVSRAPIQEQDLAASATACRTSSARRRRGALLAALVMACSGAPVLAEDAPAGIEAALRHSQLILDWRVRYETVSQAGFDSSAEALTSRLRAGLATAPWQDTSLLIEGVWIEDIIDDYNSTTNGNAQYPVVPDPAGFAAVNRLALINESLPGTRLTLGRQRIVHANARFVGNVGWRQHEQTFDGLRAETALAEWQVDLAYANQVNRIFGPDSPVGRWRGDLLLAHVSRPLPIGQLTLFGQWLDIDEAPAQSSAALGARLNGSQPVGGVAATYAIAYARQSEAGANPETFSERYHLLEAGLEHGRLALALGYEVLSGNGRNAFSTPLATLHAFLGWADVFLATPAAGIEDRYLRLTYGAGSVGPFSSVNLVAVGHDFHASRGSGRYGRELDLQVSAATGRMLLGLKYATYSARTLGADVDKLWLSLDYSF